MRIAQWGMYLTIPVWGLALLLARPGLDTHLRHPGLHFWLVLGTAAVSLVLAVALLRAARRRVDGRLFLVSLVFQLNAGFLGLHALATPGVLVGAGTAGFDVATPTGLALGSAAALASSADLTEDRARLLLRRQAQIGAVPWVLLGLWVLLWAAGAPPPASGSEAPGVLLVLAALGVPLYLLAAYRYLRVYRRRPASVLLSVLTAFVLLAEALLAVALGRSWRASWWEWHLLMVAAFGLIALSAHRQFRREGSALGLFDSLTLRQTVAGLERDYAAALEELTDALQRRAEGGVPPDEPIGTDALRLARRFGLSDRQVAVLQQGAAALGREREQVRRLGALVRVGERASIIRGERQLLRDVMALARDGFPRERLRLAIVHDGVLTFDDDSDDSEPPPEADTALRTLRPVVSDDGGTLVLPLAVKQHPAGLLTVHRERGAFGDADRALLTSLAGQMSVALENARLYQQLDGLFRSYMSPSVATTLISDPDQAGLGGRIAEVTVLMADLSGFTTFAEHHPPDAVVAMLNTYYGAVVPVVLDHGGTVVQFVGDAVMALFNAPTRQVDHARRAARTALALHRAVEVAAAGRHDWPRFRVGLNTGPALVGNIGADQMRNYTAIGDTTNLAARLQSVARPGQVVLSGATLAHLEGSAVTRPLGTVQVAGRREPVTCYVLAEVQQDVR